MSRLRETIATPDGKAPYVRGLFATIADRYDLITVLLSYGQDRRWKRRLVRMAAPREGERALDLACGTGDIAFALAGCGASVTGLDVVERMVQLARRKQAAGAVRPAAPVSLIVGDMSTLPFPSRSFDLVTTGYGLRNVPDLSRALAEVRRVLRPGGRLLSLDFNRPADRLVRIAYLSYLSAVGSVLGWILHRDPDTYRYISESIRTYPGAAGVVSLLEAAGFEQATWYGILGGLMAIHVARVPNLDTAA